MDTSVEERTGPGRVALVLTLLAAFAWGSWLRVEGLGAVPLYGDENHSADLLGRPPLELLTTYDTVGTHVPLPLLQSFAGWLLGPGVLALRLPAVLAGIAALALTYVIGRRLVGANAAALAALALALNPLHVYYSRFARAYAITVVLTLVLVGLLDRAEQRGWRGKGTLVAVALTAALAPWVHLSSAGSVAGLALAAIAMAWARGGARAAVRPLLAFAAAASICLALYLPVWDQLVVYLTKSPDAPKDRPSGALGIAVLMAGGAVAAGVWLVGAALAAGLFWRRQRRMTVLLAASVIGPAAALLATLPHGMEYAYARYLLNAIPVVLLALAWLVVQLAGERAGPWIGLVLVAGGYAAGPQSPLRADEGPFANTYLTLYPLPPFDQPFPRAPEIYRTIAADPEVETIIEFPILDSRSVFLYRNYFRTHGKRVLLGVARVGNVRMSGPYAFVGDPELGQASGAQYLVVHKDVEAELGAYWSFVYDSMLPEFDGIWVRTFMRQHREYSLKNRSFMGQQQLYLTNTFVTEVVADVMKALRTQLGKTFYEDWYVAVWKLEP